MTTKRTIPNAETPLTSAATPLLAITFTGVDVRTDISSLPGGVEYGVLFTATPEGRNRYPSRLDVWNILRAMRGRKISLHVCGRLARRKLLDDELPELVEHVQRIQINGQLDTHELETACDLYPDREIITQGHDRNLCLLRVFADNHSILVDASGGRGLSPREWIRPATNKPVGFAGGLGPDNVAEELAKIRGVAVGDWWIDMEGKLRDDDDWFDVQRVAAVIAACDG